MLDLDTILKQAEHVFLRKTGFAINLYAHIPVLDEPPATQDTMERLRMVYRPGMVVIGDGTETYSPDSAKCQENEVPRGAVVLAVQPQLPTLTIQERYWEKRQRHVHLLSSQETKREWAFREVIRIKNLGEIKTYLEQRGVECRF